MTDTATNTVNAPAGPSLARQRILWAIKPLGLLVLILWVLHPQTADQPDHAHSALLGFLFGAVYGLAVCLPLLLQYIQIGKTGGREQMNRVPDEYYWGEIKDVMFNNK